MWRNAVSPMPTARGRSRSCGGCTRSPRHDPTISLIPHAAVDRARRAGARGVPGRVWALPAVAVAVAGRAVKSRLAAIGIAALIALAFVLDEIVAHKRLSAAVVALILAGLVLPWWADRQGT